MNSNTKELNKLFLKLHATRNRIDLLNFEQAHVDKDRDEYLLTRAELEDEVLNILRQIESTSKQSKLGDKDE